jgi:hypothetical protein
MVKRPKGHPPESLIKQCQARVAGAFNPQQNCLSGAKNVGLYKDCGLKRLLDIKATAAATWTAGSTSLALVRISCVPSRKWGTC